MKTWFTAVQFTPTQWDTAEGKAKFATHFMRFLESEFKQTLFQKWFYRKLSNTFGHIAHFDIHGFWSEFFETTRDKVKFLKQTIQPWTGFAGDPAYTYSDVERAIAEQVQASGYLAQWETRLEGEVESAERSQLAHLKSKYEKPS